MSNISATPQINDSRANDIVTNYLYIGFGTASFVTNIFIILIFIRLPQLGKKSAFFIGLALGDIINGIGLVITGPTRIQYYNQGLTLNAWHPFECLKGFTTLWLVGIQVPTTMMFLIAAERFIAVVCFAYYYKQWTSKMSWILTLIAYVYCIISIGVGWVVVYLMPANTLTGIVCMTPLVVGPKYSIYNYGFPISCGTAAVASTVLSLCVFLKKKSKMAKRQTDDKLKNFVKRQIHMTVSMLAITAIDFALVVVPNVILLMLALDFPFAPSVRNVGAYAAILFCVRSILSFFVYTATNSDFRASLASIMKFQLTTKIKPETSQTDHGETRKVSQSAIAA